jgi:hypothetical protein
MTMTIDKVVLLDSLLPHTLRRGGAASHRIKRAPGPPGHGRRAVRRGHIALVRAAAGFRGPAAVVVSDPFLWEPGNFWNNDSTVTRGRRGPGSGADYLLSAN